jgi:hypothetical protein
VLAPAFSINMNSVGRSSTVDWRDPAARRSGVLATRPIRANVERQMTSACFGCPQRQLVLVPAYLTEAPETLEQDHQPRAHEVSAWMAARRRLYLSLGLGPTSASLQPEWRFIVAGSLARELPNASCTNLDRAHTVQDSPNSIH